MSWPANAERTSRLPTLPTCSPAAMTAPGSSPGTGVNTPAPGLTMMRSVQAENLEGTNNKKLGGVRLDYQLSTQTRLMGKVSAGRLSEPFGLGNQQHPAATNTTSEHNNEVLGQLTQVLVRHRRRSGSSRRRSGLELVDFHRQPAQGLWLPTQAKSTLWLGFRTGEFRAFFR